MSYSQFTTIAKVRDAFGRMPQSEKCSLELKLNLSQLP
jgi:hypothetical protein